MAINDRSDFPNATNDWKYRFRGWDIAVRTDAGMPGQLDYYLSLPAGKLGVERVQAEIYKKFEGISAQKPIKITFKLRIRGELPQKGLITLSSGLDENAIYLRTDHTPTFDKWDEISVTLQGNENSTADQIRIIFDYPFVAGAVIFDIDEIFISQEA